MDFFHMISENSNIPAKGGLSASALKILACGFMLADHLGYFCFPQLPWLRIIGRLSFPIFGFMLANSFRHTRSKGRYLLRLLAVALLFQPVFSWCTGGKLNIFFTLAAGFAAISLWELGKKQGESLPGFIGAVLVILAAQWLRLDYQGYGVAMIFLAHLFFDDFEKLFASWMLLNFGPLLGISGGSEIQMFSLGALFLLRFYNHKPGVRMRWFFYLFYCLHIPILYIIGKFWLNPS